MTLKYLQNIEILQDVIGKQLRIISEEETDEPTGYMVKDGEVTELRLRQCSLSKIPEIIFEFTELELLDLIDNNIKVIPWQIQWLKKLEHLYLTGNKISELPDEIGYLERLISLYLNRNSIYRLPYPLFKLTGLRILRLSMNKLMLLPREIISLSNLVILDLSLNQLEALPDEICELPSLEVLDLTLNHITLLPGNFGNLLQLKRFSLDGNLNFEVLPVSITKLKNLEMLILPNPVPFWEIDVQSWLKRLREKGCIIRAENRIPDMIDMMIPLEDKDAKFLQRKSLWDR